VTVNIPEHLNLQQHYCEKIKSLLGVYPMNTGNVSDTNDVKCCEDICALRKFYHWKWHLLMQVDCYQQL